MRGDCYADVCPARRILTHVTGRWGSLVLAALVEGTLRYSALRARIGGISEKMLAQTLRELEADGLVTRTSRPVVPPHVDYALTAHGRGIAAHLHALIDYIETNVVELAPGAFAALSATRSS